MNMKACMCASLLILASYLAVQCHSFSLASEHRAAHPRTRRLHSLSMTITKSNLNLSAILFENGGKLETREKRFVKAPSKWKKQLLSFRIENYSPDLDLDLIRLAIYHALDSWSRVSTLEFYEVFHGDADLMIKFGGRTHGDKYNFDGKGNVLAHAFYPGRKLGGDMHFDEDEVWGLGPKKGTDLFVVAAHELGHALGLDHSKYPGALMNPLYSGYQENFKLPADDVNGIRYLYGGRRRVDPRRPTLPPLPVHHAVTGITGITGTPHVHGLFEKGHEGMIPEPCLMTYDAVTLIRGELHVFIKRWYWRFNKKGLVSGFPSEVHALWNTLDLSFPQIGAAYERPSDKHIIFFIEKKYYDFALVPRVIHPELQAEGGLTDIGLPDDITRVDAILVWGKDKRVYVFSGTRYWKLVNNRVTDVKEISEGWPGVPSPVDSAFSHWDGKVYFFKGYRYWQFDDTKNTVTARNGQLIKEKWMDCKGVVIPDDHPMYGNTGRRSKCDHMRLMWYLLVVVVALLY